MKKLLLPLSIGILVFIISCTSDGNIAANDPTAVQGLYFPPTMGEWETVSVSSLEWNEAALAPLFTFLEEKNTKAFIILKDGRIAVEQYFNGAGPTDNNPWNSAGKTLTAFTIGIAQQEGFLSLQDPSSNYLGAGWSSLQASQEAAIKVFNHITMTSGLDYTVADNNCTAPSCLTYLNGPGTFWYYHNAPYTLTQGIVAGAVGSTFTEYFNTKLKSPIGMQGTWVPIGYNMVYFSTARSMARFGLLNLNKGAWDTAPILSDQEYFTEMTTTSQQFNKSYGYLWWLNGKESLQAPASILEFPVELIPAAPDDLFAGLGKNDQKLYVVPSKGLVVIRMGGSANGESLLGPSSFDNDLWEKINDVIN